MALKIKTVTMPKGGLHGRSCHSIWDVNASGLSCTRLADFLPIWDVNASGLSCARLADFLPIWDVNASGLSCTRLADFLPTWDVNASGMSCTRLADFLPPWQSIGWDVVVQPGPGVQCAVPAETAETAETADVHLSRQPRARADRVGGFIRVG